MKKLFAFLLVTAMLFSLTACSGEGLNFDGDAPMDSGSGGIFDGAEGNIPLPDAGLLTAGEYCDLEDIGFWTELLNRNDWYKLMEGRDLYPNSIKRVSVKDGDGSPCYNAKVELLSDTGDVLYISKTDVNGYAYLFYNLNKEGKSAASVRVEGGEAVTLAEAGLTEITLNDGKTDVTALDLMFVTDTTGSMSDELSYLQKELADVVSRVAGASEDVLSIRVSVNFYRDEGDDYVVRAFDFTEDIESVMSDLEAQISGGGGDYPEAVHKALDNAVLEHQWRDDAVKLVFFVLDAPPHPESEIPGINRQIQNAVTEAARRGIRIIPVASSGVDTETEFLLRSYAAMTGGTYIFLTNHSGIGSDHLEPTVGQYKVEYLNECLIRVISEYCGLEYIEPEQ